MRFLSLFSGIEAASVAWHPLGWEAAAYAEIEPFPCAVLAHHYPDVPNLGNVEEITADAIEALGPVDVLVGGSPCQSFSVAGRRAGLDDPRGNLAFEFLRVASLARPEWVVFENVPGLLSSGDGRDFGAFLGGLAELGYGFAYRVLDAQYFGVAQRRRRVFVVGCAGGQWQRAAAVLVERESLSGHPAPRREAGAGVAVGAPSRIAVSSGRGWWDEADVAAALRAQESANEADTVVAALTAHGVGTCGADDNQGQAGHLVPGTDCLIPAVIGDVTEPLGAKDIGHGVCFQQNSRHEVRLIGGDGSHAGALAAEPGVQQQNYVMTRGVRRLTPTECERLQGFPDSYTRIPWKKKPPEQCPDGPRYRALGNSMAVPVVRWLGERIELVERLT